MVRFALIGTSDDVAKLVRLISRIHTAQLAAVAVRDARATRTFDANAEIITDDFASLLSNHATEFDAAIVLGDPRDSLADCQRAIGLGKHLLLEQFLALSPADIADVAASCSNAGIRLMAGDSLRFHPLVHAIWKSHSSGQLGQPGLLRMHCWDSIGTYSQGKLTAAIDLAIWLFGTTPSHVYSNALSKFASFPPRDLAAATQPPRQWNSSSQIVHGWESATTEYDYLQSHLGFDGGGMALIDHARTLPRGDGYFSLSFIGAKGAAYADDQYNSQLLYCGGRPTALRADLADCQTLGALKEFVEAIEETRQPLASGADMLRAIQAARSVADSSAVRTAIGCAKKPALLAGVI